MMRFNSRWHFAMARSYRAIRSLSSVVTALCLPQLRQKVSSPKTPSIMPYPTRFQDVPGDGRSGFWCKSLCTGQLRSVLLLLSKVNGHGKRTKGSTTPWRRIQLRLVRLPAALGGEHGVVDGKD